MSSRRTYCGAMDEPPKRTRGEMLTQLVVILLLMAVLVGAIFFLHQYVTSHSSAPTSKTSGEVYNYSCCKGSSAQKKHYVGGEVVIEWQRHAYSDTGTSSSSITLTTQLSHRFANVKTLTSRVNADSTGFTFGPYILSAPPVTLSDRLRASPVTALRIPRGAKPGWYEVKCTSTVNGVASESGIYMHVFS
jgi:hypothetical protein